MMGQTSPFSLFAHTITTEKSSITAPHDTRQGGYTGNGTLLGRVNKHYFILANNFVLDY